MLYADFHAGKSKRETHETQVIPHEKKNEKNECIFPFNYQVSIFLYNFVQNWISKIHRKVFGYSAGKYFLSTNLIKKNLTKIKHRKKNNEI